MENQKILNLKQKLDIQIKLISKAKEEVGFSEVIKDYDGIKSQLKVLNQKLLDSNDVEESTNIKSEITNLEKNLHNNLSFLKKVEVEEKKLFSLKKSIDSVIKQLDSKKNSIDSKIKSNENKIFDFKFYSDIKNKEKLEKDLKGIEKEIGETTKEIELRIAKDKQTFDLKAMNDINKVRINDINIKLKKFDSVDIEGDKAQILNLEKINAELLIESNELQAEIDVLIKMVKQIKSELSFADSEEVNEDNSFTVKNLDIWYGNKQALFDVNIEIPKNKVIAIIGPSGCGKSTFLRTLNRINDSIPSFKAKGKILLEGEYDIFKLKSIRNRYDKIELSTLRTKVGMIFQQPNPFPMSIAKNVQYGPKVRGIKNKTILNELTENSLKDAGLWEEVKDNLKALGTSLSEGNSKGYV